MCHMRYPFISFSFITFMMHFTLLSLVTSVNIIMHMLGSIRLYTDILSNPITKNGVTFVYKRRRSCAEIRVTIQFMRTMSRSRLYTSGKFCVHSFRTVSMLEMEITGSLITRFTM